MTGEAGADAGIGGRTLPLPVVACSCGGGSIG
jgi:hypothetical protein